MSDKLSITIPAQFRDITSQFKIKDLVLALAPVQAPQQFPNFNIIRQAGIPSFELDALANSVLDSIRKAGLVDIELRDKRIREISEQELAEFELHYTNKTQDIWLISSILKEDSGNHLVFSYTSLEKGTPKEYLELINSMLFKNKEKNTQNHKAPFLSFNQFLLLVSAILTVLTVLSFKFIKKKF